ncbi:MAG: type II toxin-antitoxin system VapC family toxin [Mycobacterium sp.]
MSVVLDANVLVSLLIADEHQPAVQAHLEDWLTTGEELHAPDALPYEVAYVPARLVSEGALDVNGVTEIWQGLAAFGLQLNPLDLASEGPEIAAITVQLRRRHATDSTYVRLAQRLEATSKRPRSDLEATLWTLDSALARTAADLRLPVKLVA